MMDIAPYSVSKREFWIFYYKYRQRLWMAFAIPFLIFFLASFVPTSRYKAESVLIVRLGAEYVYQPEVGNNQNSPSSTIPFERDEIFKSEVAILSSNDLHAQVIKTIGVDKLYPDLVHPRPLTLIMASIPRIYNDVMYAVGLGEEPPTPDEIDRHRLAVAVQRFDKHFDILLEKESAVINVSYEHQDPELATQALDTLLKLYLEKRKQLYLEPRVQVAEEQVKATRDHALAAAKALDDYKRSHRIHSIDDEREQLLEQRSEMQKQATTIISPGLQQKIGYYNGELSRLDAQEREYNTLAQESKIADDAYALYSHRLDEARAYEDVERERSGSVRVIQPPTVPPEPKRLQMLIILAGLLVSVLSTLIVAAVTEFLERGFQTPERVQHNLGLPVLAIYPMHKDLLLLK